MAAEQMSRYLVLERLMLEADERGEEPFADSLRDIMDGLWLALADVERDRLNQRGMISLSSLYPITMSVTADVLHPATDERTTHFTPHAPYVLGDWRMSAA